MLKATDPRVLKFFNFIQGKPKNNDGFYVGSSQNASGLLYVIGDSTEAMIQVWLPLELIDYANAAAGSSGNRAVGIRIKGFKSTRHAAEEILRIFSSPESLARFINSSDCDYVLVTRRVASPKVHTDLRPAKEVFYSKYGFDTARQLMQKFGQALVRREFDILTMNEFELRYGL
jgi:hypothetical protein